LTRTVVAALDHAGEEPVENLRSRNLVVAYHSASSASTRRWRGGRHVRMASHYVVRCVDRAEPQTIAALRDAGVATAHEAAGRIGLSCPATLATTS
jgi:hypothetical protein